MAVKKVLSILLITAICSSLLLGVYAAPSDLSLTYDISRADAAIGEDAHDIIVPTNDIITVSFAILNDSGEDFSLESFQNEIYFDTSFFEFVGGSFDSSFSGGEKVYSDGEHRVYVNTYEKNDYSAAHTAATFKLRVIEDRVGAKSVIETKLPKATDADSNTVEEANITENNLTVTIGDPVPTYALTYVVDGNREDTIIVENRVTNLKLAPEKEGYRFVGWDIDGTIYEPGSEYTVTKDVAITAVWEQKEQYTVTFETGGGSAVDAVTGFVGDKVYLTQRSVRVGYSFGGWYSDINLIAPVTEITLNGNVVLYARWIENTIRGGGGGIGGGIRNPIQGSEDNPIVDITDPNVPLTGIPSELKSSDHFAYISGYEDKTVRPEANITRAEVAMIFYRLLTDEVKAVGETESNSFSDVNAGDWHNTAISTLQNIGLINGRTEDSFAPDENITRAEIAAIAARFSKEEYSGADKFGDIAEHWARGEINLVADFEWIVGDGGNFRPDDDITRAETITIVNRILGRQPQTVNDIITDGMITWSDNMDTNVWYYLAVQEATNGHDFERKENSKAEKWTALKN